MLPAKGSRPLPSPKQTTKVGGRGVGGVLNGRGSIPPPAARESVALTTELLTLAVARVKRRLDTATRPAQDWKSEEVG